VIISIENTESLNQREFPLYFLSSIPLRFHLIRKMTGWGLPASKSGIPKDDGHYFFMEAYC